MPHRRLNLGLAKKLGLAAINQRDKYTAGHCERVKWLGGKILNQYLVSLKSNYPEGYETLLQNSKDDLELLTHKNGAHAGKLYGYRFPSFSYAAYLHDIGKISWQDVLLAGDIDVKAHNALEKVQKSHPVVGAEILYDCFKEIPATKDSALKWLLLILYHHRNYTKNGNDYPLRSELSRNNELDEDFIRLTTLYPDMLEVHHDSTGKPDINISRVMLGAIRIADELDARTTYRPYRDKGLSPKDFDNEELWIKIWEEVIANMENRVGSDFHPDVFRILKEEEKAIRDGFWDRKNLQQPEERAQIVGSICPYCRAPVSIDCPICNNHNKGNNPCPICSNHITNNCPVCYSA